MSVELKINDRKLRDLYLALCYDEGVDPVTNLEAWLRRAVRQDGTVQPRDVVRGNVRQFDRAGGVSG